MTKRRMETIPAPPTTTRLRISGIPPMSLRLGLLIPPLPPEGERRVEFFRPGHKPEPTQFTEPYSTITLSVGPTVWDPTDQAPIFIRPEGVTLAARGVFARLAVWYLRRYVLAICRGEK